ncbi:MAG: hypothetical protein HY293_14620 [Planctomycetes bacterium]|nr:hypothetical protein [Planctomycetota bacterium]
MRFRSARKLRYFEYLPPRGGFGGDWDSLDAQARALAAFGYAGSPPIGTGSGDLGLMTPAGMKVGVGMNRKAVLPGEGNTIQLTAGICVMDELIGQAGRLEAWLDTPPIRMVPRARSRS